VAVPTPEVAPLSTIVEAMMPVIKPWRSSLSSMLSINLLVVCRWLIFFFHRSVILLQVAGGMSVETLTGVLNFTRGVLSGGVGVML
jgi:hypothetical protein